MSDGRSRAKTVAIVVGVLVVGFYGSFYLLPSGFHPCDDLSVPYVGAGFDVTARGDGDIRITHRGGKELNGSNTYRLFLYLEDNETGNRPNTRGGTSRHRVAWNRSPGTIR